MDKGKFEILNKKNHRNSNEEEEDTNISHKKFKLESTEDSSLEKCVLSNKKKEILENSSSFDESEEKKLMDKMIEISNNFEDIKDDFSYLIYNDLRGIKIDPKSKELFDKLKQSDDYRTIEDETDKFCVDLEKKLEENKRKIQMIFPVDNKQSTSTPINITKNPNSNTINEDKSKIINNSKNNEANDNNNQSNLTEKQTQDKVSTNNNTNNNINNKSNSSQQQHPQSKQIPKKEFLVKKIFFGAILYQKINVDTIEIINNGLTDLSLQILLSAVKFKNNIIHLNLSSNPIKTRVAYILGTVLRYNTKIVILDVSRCSLDDRCIFSIADGANLLDENNKNQLSLERISFKDNPFTNNSDESLEKILLNCPNLKWLNLTNIKLGNIGACKLFNMLLNNMESFINLKVLLMIGNGIYNENCLEILSNVLKNEKCGIKTLNLSKNPIGKFNENNSEKINFLKILLESFKNKNNEKGNKSVTELMFLSCDLSVDYTNDICEMLCNNNTLTKINFYGNNFSNQEDFEKILTIFSNYDGKKGIDFRNNTLKSLDLSKNGCSLNITDEFLKIFDGLNLEYLDIDQNQMNQDQKEKFKEATNKLSEKIKIIY